MIFLNIAMQLAAFNGFQSKIEGDRLIYWDDNNIFSTLITDGKISGYQFRMNILNEERLGQ